MYAGYAQEKDKRNQSWGSWEIPKKKKPPRGAGDRSTAISSNWRRNPAPRRACAHPLTVDTANINRNPTDLTLTRRLLRLALVQRLRVMFDYSRFYSAYFRPGRGTICHRRGFLGSVESPGT